MVGVCAGWEAAPYFIAHLLHSNSGRSELAANEGGEGSVREPTDILALDSWGESCVKTATYLGLDDVQP